MLAFCFYKRGFFDLLELGLGFRQFIDRLLPAFSREATRSRIS